MSAMVIGVPSGMISTTDWPAAAHISMATLEIIQLYGLLCGAQPSTDSLQVQGGNLRCNAISLTVGIHINLLSIVEKIIHMVINLSFLLTWCTDVVVQRARPGLLLILKWWLTVWGCRSNGTTGIAIISKCDSGLFVDEISSQSNGLRYLQILAQLQHHLNYQLVIMWNPVEDQYSNGGCQYMDCCFDHKGKQNIQYVVKKNQRLDKQLLKQRIYQCLTIPLFTLPRVTTIHLKFKKSRW
jgi:hypothetical protein